MPRKLRAESPTGYYHVMARGIDKQIIFEEESDRWKYLFCIEDALKKYNVKVICYCLMINHVHFVIYDDAKHLSRFIQSVNGKYAMYFNNKYKRIGPLFHDRFRSEIIFDQRHLLSAYRYVLNNPYKAGICGTKEYKWNSYSWYGKPSKIVDTSIIEGILGDETAHFDFVSSYIADEFIDIMPSKFNDEDAIVVVKELLKIQTGSELLNYNKRKRDEGLVKLKHFGLTTKQIQRVTGASPAIIKKACKGLVKECPHGTKRYQKPPTPRDQKVPFSSDPKGPG